MAVTTVVTNSLLLYLASPNFKLFFQERFDIKQETTMMWIIIAIEHAIIIIKFLLQSVINDRPGWVDKVQKKIEYEEDKLE